MPKARWQIISAFTIVSLMVSSMTPLMSEPTHPQWWTDSGVTNTNAVQNNAAVSIGQLKHVANASHIALEDVLPTGVSYSLPFPVPAEPDNEWYAEQKKAVNLGQLKAVAKPLYDELNNISTEWVEQQLNLNGLDTLGTNYYQDSDSGYFYPWNPATPVSENYGLASIGQLKAVFALRFETLEVGDSGDSDGDGILDEWELELVNFSDTDAITSIEQITTTSDFDGDGLIDFDEYTLGTNGTSIDSDGDGLSDNEEVVTYSTDPNKADTDGDLSGDKWELDNGFDPLDGTDISITDYAWQQLGEDIDGQVAGAQIGKSVALSASGEILALGSVNSSSNGDSTGHVSVYQSDENNQWQQLGLDIYGGAAGDHFGASLSVSADGKILAVGSTDSMLEGGTLAGYTSVYILDNNNQWQQLGGTINDDADGDGFGCSVSLSADGEILAIGAPGNSENGYRAGHVRVYKLDQNQEWQQLGTDIDAENAEDQSGKFGVTLSSNGKILAIDAYYNDDAGADAGHVRFYHLDENQQWQQLGVDIDGEAAGDLSGTSVSLSADGKTVAIGAPGNDGNEIDTGHVRVYELNYVLDESFYVDTDGDGISDGLENQNGLDPADPWDAFNDNDGDGLTNAEELLAQNPTDPNETDTNGDGVPDGVALSSSEDPDLDGLIVSYELNTVYTNPLSLDTDNDGLPDWYELAFTGLNPTDPTDASEIEEGSQITVFENYVLTTVQKGEAEQDNALITIEVF